MRRGRLSLKDDKAFPAVLAFKYAEFVRARGELMFKNPAGKRLPWADVLKMTDDEFVAQIGATKAELVALQKEVEQTPEIDITDKALFRYIGRLQGVEEIGNK